MAAIDFMLSDSSDIQIVNGKFVLLETIPQSVRQRLQTKFRTFKGEWFLNTTYGVPWFDGVYGGVYTKGILGKSYSKSDIDAILINAALEEADIIRIVSINSTLNKFSRMYDVTMEVLTTDGLIRLNIPSYTPNDEIDYPVPPEFIVTPDCSADNIPTSGMFADNLPVVAESLIPTQFNYIVLGTYSGYLDGGYVEDGYVS